jgi:hypothetical protein
VNLPARRRPKGEAGELVKNKNRENKMGERLTHSEEFQEDRVLSREANVIIAIMAAGEYAGYKDKEKLLKEIEDKFNKSIFDLNDREVDWVISDLCDKGRRRKEN